MEEWRDIKGYEGKYQVSNLGRVKSRHKILKPNNVKGYLYVYPSKNSKKEALKVHRLVAEAFIDNPENKPEVNHIDGNKENNRVENLEWCTKSENMQHAIKTGLMHQYKTGEGPLSRKIICINTGEIYNSSRHASKETGIDNSNITKCCRGKQNSAGKLPTGEKLKWMYIEED